MRKHADENTDPPSSALVEALEVYGYKPAAVKGWTTSHAKTVLGERKKADAIVQRRAIKKAEAEGVKFSGTPAPRGVPVPFMRLDAARFLAEPMSADDLTGAVASCVYQLDDSELKRLAGYLARLLAADDGRCPDYLRHLATPAGGDRGETAAQPPDAPAGDPPAGRSRTEGRTRHAVAVLPGLDRGDEGSRRPALPGV